MAKRANSNEGPYRPLLDTGLVSAVIAQAPAAGIQPLVENFDQAALSKVIDLPSSEPPRRIEQIQPEIKETHPQTTKQPPQLFEKFDQEKRILFTRGETQAIDRLVTALAARVGTQVKVSHVIRALTALLLHSEAHIDKRAGEAGTLARPANGDAQALQRFEKEIANIFSSAIRDAGPVR